MNAAIICPRTYRVLNEIARSEVRNDRQTLRRLVASPDVRRRIGAHGRDLRTRRLLSLHVVPNIVLSVQRPGYFGAGLYLTGQTSKGRVKEAQTVYLKTRGGHLVVVADQPGQGW